MKKLFFILVLLIGQFTFAQDENILDNLIDDAKSLINNVDLDNILTEYQYEFGVLYIRNATLAKSNRVNAVGNVHYFFLTSNDGDKRLNNIPSRITKWPLLQSGEGNEMTLIANKLNEGWEIVQMNLLEKGVSLGGTSLGETPVGWVVHLKRKNTLEEYKSLMGYDKITYTESEKNSALKLFYPLFKNEGYEGSFEDFEELMKTNLKAVKVMYTIAKEDDYNRSLEDFKSLVKFKK